MIFCIGFFQIFLWFFSLRSMFSLSRMEKEDGFIQIVLVALEDGSFTLHIRDNAETFNPLAMELDGDIMDENANLEALGIAAIRKKASSFSYRHYQGFNTVIIQM